MRDEQKGGHLTPTLRSGMNGLPPTRGRGKWPVSEFLNINSILDSETIYGGLGEKSGAIGLSQSRMETDSPLVGFGSRTFQIVLEVLNSIQVYFV